MFPSETLSNIMTTTSEGSSYLPLSPVSTTLYASDNSGQNRHTSSFEIPQQIPVHPPTPSNQGDSVTDTNSTSSAQLSSNHSVDLNSEENRIDLRILHHVSQDELSRKAAKFKRTVMAVHAIVTQKLYKSRSSSLETYFRDSWKISRAQVYRFLDCALVLKQLEGFEELPYRERICRSLKRLAKNTDDMRKLWETVIRKSNHDIESLTSTTITSIWHTLLQSGEVTGIAEPPEKLRESERLESRQASIDLATLEEDRLSQLSEASNRSFHTPRSITPVRHRKRNRSPLTASTPTSVSSGQFPSSSSSEYPLNMMIQSPVCRSRSNSPSKSSSSQWTESRSPVLQSNQYPAGMSENSHSGSSSSPIFNMEIPRNDVQLASLLLDSFYRRGYALQPYVNGAWMEQPVMHWRLMPVLGGNDGPDRRNIIMLTPPPPAPVSGDKRGKAQSRGTTSLKSEENNFIKDNHKCTGDSHGALIGNGKGNPVKMNDGSINSPIISSTGNIISPSSNSPSSWSNRSFAEQSTRSPYGPQTPDLYNSFPPLYPFKGRPIDDSFSPGSSSVDHYSRSRGIGMPSSQGNSTNFSLNNCGINQLSSLATAQFPSSCHSNLNSYSSNGNSLPLPIPASSFFQSPTSSVNSTNHSQKIMSISGNTHDTNPINPSRNRSSSSIPWPIPMIHGNTNYMESATGAYDRGINMNNVQGMASSSSSSPQYFQSQNNNYSQPCRSLQSYHSHSALGIESFNENSRQSIQPHSNHHPSSLLQSSPSTSTSLTGEHIHPS